MQAKSGGTAVDALASKGTVHAHQGTEPSVWARAWYFVRHYLEMCAAMCVGFGVGDVLYIWAAGQAGYSAPFSQLPELSVVVVAFNMTAPMIAWMRFRGMAWRPIWEMSAGMVVLAVVLVGGSLLGTFEKSSLIVLEHGLMMPAMLVPMLFRLDMYTRKECH